MNSTFLRIIFLLRTFLIFFYVKQELSKVLWIPTLATSNSKLRIKFKSLNGWIELNWNVVLVEQTESGQYRKEEIHKDGSVTGSFGWVDPNGVLRLTDYISDAGGYRIERERIFKVRFNHVRRHMTTNPNCIYFSFY